MSKMRIVFLGLLLCSFLATSANGDPDKKKKQSKHAAKVDTLSAEDQEMINILTSLKYQDGNITLADNLGTIKLPPDFKFLDAAQSEKVLYDLWGNTKSYDPDTKLLGMIFPQNSGPVGDSSWAFVVQYENIGYVKDDDAAKIDYVQMKKDIQQEEVEENKRRVAAGSFAINFVDWAEPPYYDKERKVLYWAKNLKVAGAAENTLNYDIRILGRKGIMSMQAVAGMSMLQEVNKNKEKVLSMMEFNAGNKYSEFNPGTDKVAAWTIGGLVAGKVLAKVGFFAIILKYLKVIIIAIGAGATAIWRFITGRRKNRDESVA